MSQGGVCQSASARMVAVFNSQAGDFARKLIKTYPDSKETLTGHYHAMLMAMKLKPDALITAFYKHALPYEVQIKGHDEAFFLQKASENIAIFEGVDMAANWKASPEQVRKAIWSYMNTLMSVSAAHHSASSEQDSTQLAIKNKIRTLEQAALSSTSGEIQQMQEQVCGMVEKIQSTFAHMNNGRAPQPGDDLSPAIVALSGSLNMDLTSLEHVDPMAFKESLQAVAAVDDTEADRMVTFMQEQMAKLVAAARRQRAQDEPLPPPPPLEETSEMEHSQGAGLEETDSEHEVSAETKVLASIEQKRKLLQEERKRNQDLADECLQRTAAGIAKEERINRARARAMATVIAKADAKMREEKALMAKVHADALKRTGAEAVTRAPTAKLASVHVDAGAFEVATCEEEVEDDAALDARMLREAEAAWAAARPP